VKSLDFDFKGRKLVQIGFAGVLSGISEEGHVSDDVDGSFYLDADTGKIHSLTVEGQRTMYDDKQRVVGRLDMSFTLSVRLRDAAPELDDKTAAEAAKDPTPVQTAVLYEFPSCAVKLVHPRTWILHDGKHPPRLEFLYGQEFHQMTFNFHEDDKTPTAADYQKEVAGNLKREKFQDVKWTIDVTENERGAKGTADYKRIGEFEATASKDGDWRMRYYVWQKGSRGVTVGIFLHSKAAREGTLADDAYTFLKGLTFTDERNPFFIKPPAEGKQPAVNGGDAKK
jgi:hypothetical protein